VGIGVGAGAPLDGEWDEAQGVRSTVRRWLAVLLVDRPAVLEPLARALSTQPLDVRTTDSTADALLLVGRAVPDVVVVGPVKNRSSDLVTLVEALRRHEPELPVIVGLRPKDGRLAAVLAPLEPAAIIGYPFQTDYLVRLLRSLAPPGRSPAVGRQPIDLGRLQINGSAPEIHLDGEHLVLPLREFLLLRYLAERVGNVVSRAEIGQAVWGRPQAGANNTVAVHVTRLRRRLGAKREGARWITAVRGVGYRLTVPEPRPP
jgi:DNA-binding response OmpR family regulator